MIDAQNAGGAQGQIRFGVGISFAKDKSAGLRIMSLAPGGSASSAHVPCPLTLPPAIPFPEPLLSCTLCKPTPRSHSMKNAQGQGLLGLGDVLYDINEKPSLATDTAVTRVMMHHQVYGKSIEEIAELLLGPAGTSVDLGLKAPGLSAEVRCQRT
eukprot:3799088-Rhodomonas_salina.1